MLKHSNAKLIHTSDIYYDLMQEYIDPYTLLEMSDADRVSEAIDTILEFINFLEKEGLVEYS